MVQPAVALRLPPGLVGGRSHLTFSQTGSSCAVKGYPQLPLPPHPHPTHLSQAFRKLETAQSSLCAYESNLYGYHSTESHQLVLGMDRPLTSRPVFSKASSGLVFRNLPTWQGEPQAVAAWASLHVSFTPHDGGIEIRKLKAWRTGA